MLTKKAIPTTTPELAPIVAPPIIHVININTVAKTVCIDTPNISILPIPIMLNIAIKLKAIDSSTLTDILLFIFVMRFIPNENI